MKHRDIVVIGSGPAGQKAAVQAAKAGKRVTLIEQLREIGGACVQFGTIPSKALRERAVTRAVAFDRMRELGVDAPPGQFSVSSLVAEMRAVVTAHDGFMREQLERNGIEIVHGRAGFRSDTELEVGYVGGQRDRFTADHFVIAVGSKPRCVAGVPVDHEHLYDSDSILSLAYLPERMVVLGGGVIACEYASIFALLGVEVLLVDRYPQPLGFLDVDLSSRFVREFEHLGGTFIGSAVVTEAAFDGLSRVQTRLEDGTVLESDKLLCALGRVAALDGLQIDNTGVVVDERGLVAVSADGRTAVPHIYAAGDVIGPPSLASAAMEQGRRAVCDFLGLDVGRSGAYVPTGIYAIPELASVGLTESAAREQYPGVVVGRAECAEIARGHIADTREGMLKLVVGADRRLLGVHIVGAGATDLVHIGQMALVHDAPVDVFIDNVFNFPTYAEAYRVAALAAVRSLGANTPTGQFADDTASS